MTLRGNIGLLIQKGEVTDRIGHKFSNVSPIEYMEHLRDRWMIDKALSYIPPGVEGQAIRETVDKQRAEVRAHRGLEYDFNGNHYTPPWV